MLDASSTDKESIEQTRQQRSARGYSQINRMWAMPFHASDNTHRVALCCDSRREAWPSELRSGDNGNLPAAAGGVITQPPPSLSDVSTERLPVPLCRDSAFARLRTHRPPQQLAAVCKQKRRDGSPSRVRSRY